VRGAQIDAEVIRGLDDDAARNARLAIAVERASVEIVLDRAVAVAVRNGYAGKHDIGDDRATDGAEHAPCVARAVTQFRFALERVRRAFRRDVDRAGDRALAVERALRAFQHLQPFDIAQVHREGISIRQDHAIHRKRNGGCLIAVGAEATDRDVVRCRVLIVCDVDVRRHGEEIVDAFEAAFLDHTCGEGRDGIGNLLQVLLALARRYDDFLKATAARARPHLLLCRGRAAKRRKCRRHHQHETARALHLAPHVSLRSLF